MMIPIDNRWCMVAMFHFLGLFAVAGAGCGSDPFSPSAAAGSRAPLALEQENPTVLIDGERYVMVSFDAIEQGLDQPRAVLLADEKKPPAAPAANPNWPKAHQLEIAITLAKVSAKNYRRPYVAIWIENTDGKLVRVISAWGKQVKYQRDLRDWWQQTKLLKEDSVDAVTRATRPPGEYKLAWDGLDDKGAAVPAGDFIVHVEAAREHGTHVSMTKTIACGKAAKTEKIAGNTEVEGVVLKFGPAKPG